MKQRKLNTVFWVKAMLWLLSIMFLFTMISNAAASFTVAQVKVESPSSRKLQYTVQVEGRIGKNREISVLCQQNLLIKSVLVSEGQRVEKGEVLAKLDGANVEEEMGYLKDKKRSLLLQNQEYQKNEDQAEKRRRRDTMRAKEDYAEIKKKNDAATAAAKKELEQAKRMLKRERAKKSFRDKAAIASLKSEVEEKKKAYQAALETMRAEEKAAKRALEDAEVLQAADSRIALNRISIAATDAEIEKLKNIQRKKCRIVAPENGVITSVLVNVGQKTLDTAVFTMTDDSAGLKFTGQMSIQDARYVSANDSITLKNENKTLEDVRITTMDMDESREFMNVTALLPAGTFSLGEAASMIVEQESKNYACTVPLSALHQENNKYYVLSLETTDTVLGKQTVAGKTEVEVLERNGQFAALEPSVLKDDILIIIDTNRYIKAGDRVRLKGEQES